MLFRTHYKKNMHTVEPRFNEPLFNEVLDITNDILGPGQSYSKMYGIEPRYNEPRYNEPRYNEVLDITNDILGPGQSYSKMYGIEPRYNEFLDITNIFRKTKRKIYLDITKCNVNTREKINAEQINDQQIF